MCLGSLALLLAGVDGIRRSSRKAAATATVGSRTARTITINAGGNSANRQYQYFVPTQCGNNRCPMLLDFHGQYGSIPNTGFDNQAASNSFVMVYLQGMGDGSCGTGWNTIAPGQDISNSCTSGTLSGTCCYNSCNSSTCTNRNRGCRWATCHDDVAFTSAVLDAMRSAVNVGDIYVTGSSNGGMMSHTLMTTMPNTFKGVVPQVGLPLVGQWDNDDVPSALSGTSVLYMHARNDRTIPADGGFAGGWEYVSIAEAMRTLASNHGCGSSTSAWSTPYDGGSRNIACARHNNCPNGVNIASCLFNGGHSAWPSEGNDLLFWFLTDNTGLARESENLSPQATIPLSVTDCGGSSHIARLSGYSPQSVQTGVENQLNAWGSISEDVSGGRLNLNAAMTGFPWTGLGSVTNHDICFPKELELRALGIWGGTMVYEGLECPVSASLGSINLPIKLTLASILPGGMANTRTDINGTASNGKPLLCASVTTQR